MCLIGGVDRHIDRVSVELWSTIGRVSVDISVNISVEYRSSIGGVRVAGSKKETMNQAANSS